MNNWDAIYAAMAYVKGRWTPIEELHSLKPSPSFFKAITGACQRMDEIKQPLALRDVYLLAEAWMLSHPDEEPFS